MQVVAGVEFLHFGIIILAIINNGETQNSLENVNSGKI